MPLQMRLPKFGFSSRIGRRTAEVRSGELDSIEGDRVNLQSLKAAGLITASIKRARIMLSGEVTRTFTVEGVAVTAGARRAIEQAGGQIADQAVADKAAKPAEQTETVADKAAEPVEQTETVAETTAGAMAPGQEA